MQFDPATENKIDQICLKFEDELRRGHAQSIEECLLLVASESRVGVKQDFLFELPNGSFNELATKAHERFLCPLNKIVGLDSFSMSDMAYVIDLTLKGSAWVHAVSLGPMTRDEWFTRVEVEPQLFEQTLDGNNIFKFRDSFPDVFLFISVDSTRKEQPLQKNLWVKSGSGRAPRL